MVEVLYVVGGVHDGAGAGLISATGDVLSGSG